MPKYRVVNRPTGCINGTPWPAKGDPIELPATVGDDMVEAGTLERVGPSRPKTEKRPAPKGKVETRQSRED